MKVNKKDLKNTIVALSIKQPWAELILRGEKTIETRRWVTSFRGEFYIHASKIIDKRACEEFKIDTDSLVTGALVGKATIEHIVEYHTDKQFILDNKKHRSGFYGFNRPTFGFLLDDIKKITPISAKGSLKFFKLQV